ncbi:MAG: Ig-like domain-containing protein, partial [Gammaproteobacteria bacterium]|nr:Ig-like domain-containing protein [Gammaproteobacteria bacterium]
TVTVIGDGTAQAATLTAADLITLGDGTITVDATNIDAAGNVSAAATQSSFVLDTIAPNVPTVTVLPGADISTSAEAQAGSVEVLAATGDVVDITFTDINNVQVVKQITGNATGTPQVIALTAAELGGLADGTITVNSTTTDLAGNVSSASNSFILSTVAPTAPVITLVAGADFATAAEASAGAITVSPITGETTDVVFSNGVNSVTVSIIGDGTAQAVTLTAAEQALLADGTITVDATSTNAAGTVSAAATQSSFVLDTVAPNAPTLTVAAGATIATAAEATAGAVTVAPLTGESTDVVFTGTAGSVTVTITGDGTAQAVVLSAADQATLGDGIITVDATTSDQAGNVSVAAAQASFTLDTAAPAAPTLTLVAGADFATAAEASAGAAELTATLGEVVTVTFTGALGAVTQTITATGTAQALTLTAAELLILGDGAVSVDASITDIAGNVSSAATSFLLDTVIATTPVFTVVAGADLATAAEASAGAISIAPAAGESTDVVFSNAVNGTSVTVTVVGDGTAQAVALTAADLVTLGDGTISVDAVSTDTAGNVSAAAVQSSFVLDTVGPVAPTVAVTPAGSIATAVEAAAGAIEVSAAVGEVTSVVFTGTLGSVTISVTGTGAPQAVALTAAQMATLGDGAVTVDASNSDLAGNLATSSSSFTLDTLAAATPILTITDANATSAVAAGTVSIAPAVGETTTVIFTNGSNAVNTTVIKIIIGTGAAQTVTLTAADLTTLGEGTIFLNALSTDLAGNVSTQATSNFIIDDTAPSVTAVTPADNAIGVLATDNIVITLSENAQAGTGTFSINNGAGDVRTIDVNDATQVTVTGNTVTINPTGDLVGGSNYAVTYAAGVLTDLAGNGLAAQINPIAQNFTTAATPVDPTVVVFDLVGGTSSAHSGRVFDANISYTIHVIVDPANGALNTAPAVGAVGTFGTWAGAGNLGADDSIVFHTSTGTLTGALGNTATVAQPTAVASSLPNASYAWTGATVNAVAAGITELGLFTRNTAAAGSSANLWNGTWAALGDGADLGGIVQATPVGLLTSQGLA